MNAVGSIFEVAVIVAIFVFISAIVLRALTDETREKVWRFLTGKKKDNNDPE